MDAIESIRGSLEMAEMVGLAYLGDLSDADLMQRPHAGCNHINWQIGHLIGSEHQMMSQIAPGKSPDLPDGFSEKYTKETQGSDDASAFATKDELLAAYKAQRAATLEILSSMTAEQLDEETGVDYAPTKGAMLSLQGAHWMMHCGQWVVIRRQTDKPVLF